MLLSSLGNKKVRGLTWWLQASLVEMLPGRIAVLEACAYIPV